MWKAIKDHPFAAAVVSVGVAIGGVVGFLAGLANIWNAMSHDTVPVWLVKHGWVMGLPPIAAIGLCVTGVVIVVCQIAILREAYSQRHDHSTLKRAAEIVVHDSVDTDRQASDVADVLHRIGWEWTYGPRTLNPIYEVGTKIVGGSDIDQELLDLSLNGASIRAQKYEDKTRSTPQIVIGKPDPRIEAAQNTERRQYEAVVAERDRALGLLADAKNADLITQGQRESIRGELIKAQDALKAKKLEFAKFILERYQNRMILPAGSAATGGRQITVTIQWLGYGPDLPIVEKLEGILSGLCGLEPHREANQDLRPGGHKVVFESAFNGNPFRDFEFAFKEGDLLDGISIGRRDENRHDNHHLVIKVLPS